MKVMILILAIIAQGCIYQDADITDIMKAEQFCVDKGGIKIVRVVFTSNVVVACRNGESKSTLNIKLAGI